MQRPAVATNLRGENMTEPTIFCPCCKTEIALTESLAAPLIAAAKRQFEERLSRKDAEIARRERAVLEKDEQLEESKRNLELRIANQVETRLTSERLRISSEESRRANLAASAELESKNRELADLTDALRVRDVKLSEAQKAQVALIKKERELDDAKREVDLTVEKRVQISLSAVRAQATREAEEGLKLKVLEKDHTIASMHQKIQELKQKSRTRLTAVTGRSPGA